VSIRKLKEILTATHPAKLTRKWAHGSCLSEDDEDHEVDQADQAQRLSSLAAEDDEEGED
jgi:hypothetical protein